MSNTSKRPRLEYGSNREPEIFGQRSVETDEGASHSRQDEVDNENPPSLSGLPATVLHKIFSYATHDQLALSLPLVCQKWYEVVCYSETLWDGMVEWLNSKSSTDHPKINQSNAESVFNQQFNDETNRDMDDRAQSELFGSFTVTTNALRKLRHRRPSAARRQFIAAYRRQICFDLFFREMGLEESPSLDYDLWAKLKRFQEDFDVRLPLGFFTLLDRRKIHRYIPHLWYANLKYEALDFIELPSNRILLHWIKDCQDCWCAFVLFDRHNPVPDPPVYSEPDGIDDSTDFYSFLRKYKNGDGSRDDKKRLQEAKVLESQLVLENARLSSFLEHYATEAKHWDMEDANSSIQAEDAGNSLLDNEQDSDETSDPSSTVRRSKRLKSGEGGCRNSEDEEEQEESGLVEYEDFGLRHNEDNADGAQLDDSSGEEEWKDTD